MRFECSFCGAITDITWEDYANWAKGSSIHCGRCASEHANNKSETIGHR